MKTLFLPGPIFLSAVYHTFWKHTASPPHTNTHAHTHSVLSFLDVSVYDSLATNPSVGWMSVSSPFIIRLIRHPRHCFYISQQSHWQLMALSLSLSPTSSSFLSLFPHKSFLCHFSFFSLPSATLALLVRLTVCMVVGSCTLSHLPTSSFLPHSRRPLSSTSRSSSPCPSPSIYLSPVHHWDLSGTFRAARKKAL